MAFKLFLVALLLAGQIAPAETSVPECEARGGLPNFFAKLEAGQPVRIAYFGGSITDAWGWRDFSRDWFAKQYPQAKVDQIRASIPGTGAEFGACRLYNHVLRYSPDLVFVEYAVNGAGKTDKRAIESMEGIVRQIRRHDPTTDVCFVFTLHHGMAKSVIEGRTRQVVENMKKVADHYGVPTIDFAPGVVRLMEEGKLVFSGAAPTKDAPTDGPIVFSTDGTHPLDAGHKLYLDAIVRSVPALKAAGQPGPHPLPEPLEPGNWENGCMVSIDDPGITRTGSWQKVELPVDFDKRARISHYFTGVWESTQPGDSLEFTFEGTGFGVSGLTTPNSGLFRVTVEDLPPMDVTFCDAWTFAEVGRIGQKYWICPQELPRGKHRVKIKLLSEPPDYAAILKKDGKEYKEPETPPTRSLQFAAILLAGSLTP